MRKKIRDTDKKIPDTSSLLDTTVLNTKISEVENEIPNTSNLVTKTALNTKISEVENKISNNSKHITTAGFNMLKAGHFKGKLKQADLVNKTDFDNKLTSFNKRSLQIKQNI